jgi:hypothetical protein
VLRIQREKAKSFSMEDLGLQDSDADESDSDKQTQVIKRSFVPLLLIISAIIERWVHDWTSYVRHYLGLVLQL